jgi:hypothetical protein
MGIINAKFNAKSNPLKKCKKIYPIKDLGGNFRTLKGLSHEIDFKNVDEN